MIVNKPVVVFDIETTGLDIIKDQIIDISLIKVGKDCSEEVKNFRVKPSIKISKESSEIHGIRDEDLKNSKPFKFYAKEVLNFIKGCDLGGFNILKFDLPILIEEFMRCDIDLNLENIKIIDALRLYHLMEKRNLSSAYKFYCNKKLVNAHDAYSDTKATVEIIKKQLEFYNNEQVIDNKGNVLGIISNKIDSIGSIINNNIVDISGRIIKNTDGDEVFNFGKYKNQRVEDVFKNNPQYYHWMINNDFPLHTKKKISEIRLRYTNGK
jgi:DNA polymerase-3 subunit epsilon|tara:strand:+ start:708 stop:1508 length:801 start_codon:yes stop_codon:yes gene_type:complete